MVAGRFHARLLTLDPELTALMEAAEPVRLRRLLAEVLASLAHAIDEPERLVALLVPLGRRLARYRVREEHYALVTEALIESLRETTEDRLSLEVENEWRTAVALAGAVLHRAAGS